MSMQKSDYKPGAGRKGSLFCPDCERSAPVTEWQPISRSDGRTDVTCPDCGTIVVSQPRFDTERSKTPISV